MSSTFTFLWHDYETFGANPRRDRPAQFAAIRTDAELNEIGEPIMLYCQPAPDFLPDPQSCLITGITPQHCLEHGVPEHEFAAVIEEALAQPGTIGVGYNTIRFDDEMTRFMFWRNLIDPYAREWQNGCGRWDILDMLRTAYALRPDGIVWPKHEDGSASFKLEHLTAANGLSHDSAHDALSDVRATIALARLVRERQPKLFEFCLSLHKKDRVAAEMGLPMRKPFLHISGMFPTERGCLTLVCPLAQHPTNKNEVIVWDCRYDPAQLAGLDAPTIRARMFTKTEDLAPDTQRLPIKTIHLNRAPIVINALKILSPALAQRWGLDIDQALQHAQAVAARAEQSEQPALWQAVYQREPEGVVDVDEDLYGGFVGNEDRRKLNQLRFSNPERLVQAMPVFADVRLQELVFRYRARNFAATLSADEAEQWQTHCAEKLLEGQNGCRTIDTFEQEINELEGNADQREKKILRELMQYIDYLSSN